MRRRGTMTHAHIEMRSHGEGAMMTKTNPRWNGIGIAGQEGWSWVGKWISPFFLATTRTGACVSGTLFSGGSGCSA